MYKGKKRDEKEKGVDENGAIEKRKRWLMRKWEWIKKEKGGDGWKPNTPVWNQIPV